jgi:hypothetical protein
MADPPNRISLRKIQAQLADSFFYAFDTVKRVGQFTLTGS